MLIRRIAKKSYFRFPFSSNRVYPLPDSKYQQNSNTKFVTSAFFVVVVMLVVVVMIVFMVMVVV